MGKKLGQKFGKIRKFGNKAMKGTSIGLKKGGEMAEDVGTVTMMAGMASGNPQLVSAGRLMVESGGLARHSGGTVEKLRTAENIGSVKEAIEEGVAIGKRIQAM